MLTFSGCNNVRSDGHDSMVTDIATIRAIGEGVGADQAVLPLSGFSVALQDKPNGQWRKEE
jgi:hypothetical protein